MKCPVCDSTEHRTLETADSGSRIRRRRCCDRCKHRWTTFEAIDAGDAKLVPLADLEAILDRLTGILGRG
jgi:transcriptional repressor NrdR